MLCKLCQTECSRLAKSHIVARGFFPRKPKGKLLYTACGNGDSRKLQNALWDSNIVCDKCEHDILAPLDECAVRVFSHHESSMRWNDDKGSEAAVFARVDRRNLRAYFASLLWRCSMSVLPEYSKFIIGKTYEERIAIDLLSNGEFSYIDAIVSYLKNELHGGMVISGRTRLGMRGSYRVNGFNISIPHLNAMISLDQRPHPLRDTFDTTLNIDGAVVRSSCSLADEKADMAYSIPIVETLPTETEKIYATFRAYLKNAPRIRKIKRSRGGGR